MRFIIFLTILISFGALSEEVTDSMIKVDSNIKNVRRDIDHLELRLESSKLLNVPSARFYCEESLKTEDKQQLQEALLKLEEELTSLNPTLKGEFGIIPCEGNKALVDITYSKRSFLTPWTVTEVTKVLGVMATNSRCEVETHKAY